MNYLKQVFKIIGLLCLISIIASIVLFLMWKQNETVKEDGIRIPYLDERVGFQVYYPYNWDAVKGNVNEEDKKGVYVYVEKDKQEIIYCYYTDKNINIEDKDIEAEDIETTEGLKGTVFIKEQGQRIIVDVVFEGQTYGVHIDISKENWEKYEESIRKIVKSFKITQPFEQ